MQPPTDATAHWQALDVDADGVSIRVHRTGSQDRRSLVLLHGLSDSGRCWWRVAQRLEAQFDIVMVDARNHGDSGTGGGGADRLAVDVAAVVATLDLERPAVMGHSVGARTAADYAAAHPAEVSRLVLIDPPWTLQQEHQGDIPEQRREVSRTWLASFANMTSEEITTLGREQHPSWPGAEFAAWTQSKRQVRPGAADNLAGTGWGDAVAAIDCPTLLVHGDSGTDGIVTDAVVRRVVELNRRVTAARVMGAGHNIHREQFDRFIKVVRPFLLSSALPNALP